MNNDINKRNHIGVEANKLTKEEFKFINEKKTNINLKPYKTK